MQEELVQGHKMNGENKRSSPVDVIASTSDYYDPLQFPIQSTSQSSESYYPPAKSMKIDDDLMEIEELQHFIKIPNEPSLAVSPPIDVMEEEDRLYKLATLYIEQFVNLNMRRRLTYANVSLSAMFDNPCVCPFDLSDMKPLSYDTYRYKNRNDYTMILDYVNRFPEFHLLNKSEKTVLFQTTAAVDALADPAYYSQVIYPDEPVFVTREAKYLKMDPMPSTELEVVPQDCNLEDITIYKNVVLMIRRQWKNVNEPLRKLKLSLAEFSLFKALAIWHYNYYKLQNTGRQISARQRDDIFRTLLLICEDEGYDDPILRVSEIVLAVGIVMSEVHELVTTMFEITVFANVDDPILKDMLKFQY
ncbi:NR LBD domain-containing protein [Caenorhabditis elegans]|nr:NR LBD domain-containing protein [Caenorhabditis elegans]CTQ87000.1 NR LBD domain-containing protein [Caenorhabditis elegans]|eukprot:NP_001300301.1 Nuclear Hormone Receptor family [Caenorhabditis elegans]